jgi:diadenylate cyclase
MNALTSLLHRPRIASWWDIADILIVSFIIYQALKLIRGTRAMQMAIGSLLVLILLYASQHLPLQTLNWLIRSVLTYAVIAAIVLFQADIRRALSHVGSAPFFRYFARSEQVADTIEEIVTAAGLLAKDRVGAIVVFEREIGLRNYVESGIRVDGVVSYENRIAAAACFLPLTVSPKLDRDLGTRHRAAIGLTEESDAIAVVVSEERGEISIALQGQLERNLSPEELRSRLQILILHKRMTPADEMAAAEIDA